jgi:Cu(I)/Ag(I) efflux system protein CusF
MSTLQQENTTLSTRQSHAPVLGSGAVPVARDRPVAGTGQPMFSQRSVTPRQFASASASPTSWGVATRASPAATHTEPAASTSQELLSEGKVRKATREAGKLTLRHGSLADLGMPAMTMVFTATDANLLDGLKEGNKVRFTADKKDGSYRAAAIQLVN